LPNLENLRLVLALDETITGFRRSTTIPDIVNGKVLLVDTRPSRAEMLVSTALVQAVIAPQTK
jgi:hypothetical protein